MSSSMALLLIPQFTPCYCNSPAVILVMVDHYMHAKSGPYVLHRTVSVGTHLAVGFHLHPLQATWGLLAMTIYT